MKQTIITTAIYLLGFFFSFQMLRIEHEAEKKVYTIGDKIMTWFLSLFSFAMVMFILIKTWLLYISKTGYWSKPVKGKDQKTGKTK